MKAETSSIGPKRSYISNILFNKKSSSPFHSFSVLNIPVYVCFLASFRCCRLPSAGYCSFPWWIPGASGSNNWQLRQRKNHILQLPCWVLWQRFREIRCRCQSWNSGGKIPFALTEVKQYLARSVLRWETAWEHRVLLIPFELIYGYFKHSFKLIGAWLSGIRTNTTF